MWVSWDCQRIANILVCEKSSGGTAFTEGPEILIIKWFGMVVFCVCVWLLLLLFLRGFFCVYVVFFFFNIACLMDNGDNGGMHGMQWCKCDYVIMLHLNTVTVMEPY